jgi:hypothetical protein
MDTYRKNLWALAGLLLLGWGWIGVVARGAETAAQAPTLEPIFTPILTRVLAEPIVVLGSDRRWHLVYELELRNATAGSAVLEQVEVRDADRRVVLETLSGTSLAERWLVAGQHLSATLLEAAQFGILYLHLSFPDRESVPDTLEHWVTAQLTAPAPGPERSFSMGCALHPGSQGIVNLSDFA